MHASPHLILVQGTDNTEGSNLSEFRAHVRLDRTGHRSSQLFIQSATAPCVRQSLLVAGLTKHLADPRYTRPSPAKHHALTFKAKLRIGKAAAFFLAFSVFIFFCIHRPLFPLFLHTCSA